VPRLTEDNRRWWTLIGACMGLFVLMLDSTVVTLALPSIQRGLDASASELQWVVNAYLLSVAVLVVTCGRLGDMFGRRAVFLASLLVFTAGLLVAATAPSVEVLVVARVIQGAGAAGMLGLSLALVSSAFSDDERPRALGIWAGVSSIALAIGPVVGGVLVEQLSWRWVFWIGVPPLAAGVLLTWRATLESRDEGAGHRLDVPGLATLTIGLTGIVLGLVQGHDWGWGSARTAGALGIGAACLVAFVRIEPRVRQPIVELPLFRNRPYLGATVASFTLVGAYWAVIFYLPQYLQSVLGYSPVASGVLVLPITVPMVFLSPLAPRLTDRFGVRAIMTTGMACGTVGVGLTTQLSATSRYAALLPGFLLFGVALGLVYTATSTAAMVSMPRAKAGIAAGVLAMNRLVAGSVVLAAMGAAVAGLQHDRIATLLGAGSDGLAASDRGELDGLLAGAPSSQQALAAFPPASRSAIVGAVHDGSAYAVGHALWIVVAMVGLGALGTWALVRSAPAGEPAAPAGAPPAAASAGDA
jgi:EmrB/QacA subfamily drug resistance transporter